MMKQGVLQEAAEGVGFTASIEGLEQFKKPQYTASIWRRPAVPVFQKWIEGLSPDQLPSARLVLKPLAVRPALEQVFDDAGAADEQERRVLIDDIAKLAIQFCDLMDAPFTRLRLDRVSGNGCSKFHIDNIVARLVCTYRGTGTQYGVSENGAQPNRVFTVATGDPMVMCGTKWPDKEGVKLLHRSPPIEGLGETRLVLVLDPIFDSDKHP